MEAAYLQNCLQEGYIRCEAYFKHLFEEDNLGVQSQVFMLHMEHFKDLVGCIKMEDVLIVIVGKCERE